MGLNQPVDLSTAKLLKEKGFNREVLHFYCKNSTCNYIKEPYKYSFEVDANQERKVNGKIDNFGYGLTWSAPTIAEVVMWMYEKHKIWIISEPCIVHNGITNIYKIFKDNYLDTISRASKGYNSPIEAYEAAIKYCLEKII